MTGEEEGKIEASFQVESSEPDEEIQNILGRFIHAGELEYVSCQKCRSELHSCCTDIGAIDRCSSQETMGPVDFGITGCLCNWGWTEAISTRPALEITLRWDESLDDHFEKARRSMRHGSDVEWSWWLLPKLSVL